MKKDYYELTKRRVLKQFNSKEYKTHYSGTEQGKTDKNHFLEVVKLVCEIWEEQEKSDVPIALKIAGLCHDLDRIYPLREVDTKNCSKEDYENRKMIHAANSAFIFSEVNDDFPKELIRDVFFLISRHEVGGDKNSKGSLNERKDEYTKKYNLNVAANYLYYTDKLSFFYSGIHEYKKRGKEKLKKKIEFSMKGLPKEIIDKIKNIEFEDEGINECIKNIKNELKLD